MLCLIKIMRLITFHILTAPCGVFHVCLGERGVYIKALFLYGSHLFFKKVLSNFLGGNIRGPKCSSETDETGLHVFHAV